MRKALAEEFSAIYILNLRGNQRLAGEQSRKEGGKVFGGGSRATVAVTLLVKNPNRLGPAVIRYTDIGDYLSTEQKLEKVATVGSVAQLEARLIAPNEQGDWINQRRDDFETFAPLRGDTGIFATSSLGFSTNRDAWVLNSSAQAVVASVSKFSRNYNQGLDAGRAAEDFSPREVSWSAGLRTRYARRQRLPDVGVHTSVAMYRPFFKQRLSMDRSLIERPGSTPDMFTAEDQVAICATGVGAGGPFMALVTEVMPNLNLPGAGNPSHSYPRWRHEPAAESGMLDLGNARTTHNITEQAHLRFGAAYPERAITKDDLFYYVYGILNSPSYQETYAADLKKMLPRIPMVREFGAYSDAGRALAALHLAYESCTPYPLDGLETESLGDPYAFYAVSKKLSFGKATAEQRAAGQRHDRSVIHYNERITLRGIPEDAYRYMLGSRSAIEWIIDRYYVKTDKDSGIVNDPNDWSREVGNPRYILDLLARVVTVSIETMKIVDALPSLDIIDTGK